MVSRIPRRGGGGQKKQRVSRAERSRTVVVQRLAESTNNKELLQAAFGYFIGAVAYVKEDLTQAETDRMVQQLLTAGDRLYDRNARRRGRKAA